MDSATKACKGKAKFISLFAGGTEEMEARQSKGQPSFVLHGEYFPKNLPEVLTDFEKMLKTFEPADNQCCLYEILENSNTSGNGKWAILFSKILRKKDFNQTEVNLYP